MDVRQLSALVAIADHGTFSAAARALFTVQSNVSSHIARLERELGTTLVDRAQGGLTDDGQRVVERARRILREMDDIAADVAPSTARSPATSASASSARRPAGCSPACSPRSTSATPNVRAIVSEGSTSVLIPSLLAGRFSAAIIHLPVDDPELVIEPLFAEDLVRRRPRRAPAGDRRRAVPRRGRRPPAAAAAARSALRRVLDRAAGTVGVQLRAQAEIDGVRLLASLASDGHGAAIVPATAVPQHATGRFGVVRVPELPPRVVALAYQRRPAPSAPSRALFDVLREVIADRSLQQPGVRVGSEAFPLSRADLSAEPRLAPVRATGRVGSPPMSIATLGLRRGTSAPVTAEVRVLDGRATPTGASCGSSSAARRRRASAACRCRRRSRPSPSRPPATARAEHLPLVVVLASTGSDIVEGIAALEGWGRLAKALVDCSGVVPTIVVVDGPGRVRSGAAARRRRPRRHDRRPATRSSTAR